MTKSIKTELWKALHNPMFYLSTAIGIAIAVSNVIRSASRIQYFNEAMASLSPHSTSSRSPIGYSLFIQWLPIARTTLCHQIYFFIWPILAAMPFGWSYHQERQNGVYNQIISRSSKQTYFISKYIAVFVSGGLAVSLPLLFDLFATAMVCPYVVPTPIIPINIISDGYFLSELYYSRPWTYAFIICFVDFLLGGITATLCISAGSKIRLQIVVILIPFATYLFLDAGWSLISDLLGLNFELSPFALAAITAEMPTPEWAVCTIIFELLLISIGFGYFQVVKHELD